MQQKLILKKEVIKKIHLEYLLHLPKCHDPNIKYPLILFLHGAGERGNDLEKVKINGIPKIAEVNENFPFISVSPQCPLDTFWPFILDEVYLLLNEIKSAYPVDHNRIYLTGLSMGGYGAWGLAIKYPNEFAALVPICGGWLMEKDALKLINMPIWVFHGEQDDIIPPEESASLVNILKKNNGNVRFTLYPDTGHDSWTKTYENNELYEWLLKQNKTKRI